MSALAVGSHVIRFANKCDQLTALLGLSWTGYHRSKRAGPGNSQHPRNAFPCLSQYGIK